MLRPIIPAARPGVAPTPVVTGVLIGVVNRTNSKAVAIPTREKL